MTPQMREDRRRGNTERAAWQLAERGLRTAVLPKRFPYRELVYRCGLRPPDRKRLLRETAGQLALAGLGARPEGRLVALHTLRPGVEFDRAVRYLAPRVRELAVFAAYGGADYVEWLRERYGVSALVGGEARRRADIHLLFDVPPDYMELPPRRTISVSAECPEGFAGMRDACFRLPETMEHDGDAEPQELLAALALAGAIRPEELEVSHLIWGEGPEGGY